MREGRKIGERQVRIEGTADDWQAAGGAMIDRLAALSADAVAPLLVKSPGPAKIAALATPLPGPTEPDTAAQKPAPGSAPGETATPTPAGRQLGGEAGKRAPPCDRAPRDRRARRWRDLARSAVTNVLRQQDLTMSNPAARPIS